VTDPTKLRRYQPRRGLPAHLWNDRQDTGTKNWRPDHGAVVVTGIEAIYAEYQERGGKVHPNGSLQTKPWGTKEFAAIRSEWCVRNLPGGKLANQF